MVATQIYTDGSHCRMGSGWAAVIVVGDARFIGLSGSKSLPSATAAELLAILSGLRWAMNHRLRTAIIYTDSRHAERMLLQGIDSTEPTEQRLKLQILRAIGFCEQIQIECISGMHKSEPQHRRWHRMCDALVREKARSLHRLTLRRIVRGEIVPSRAMERRLTRRRTTKEQAT